MANKNHYQSSLPEIPQKVSKLHVLERFSYPKQFVLTNETEEHGFEDYINIEEYGSEIFDKRKHILKLPYINLEDEDCGTTPDLDFNLPTEVRETLMSEGLSSQVIERSLGTAEKRHRQALHLTIQQQQKSLKRSDESRRQNNKLTLPRITPETNTSSCLSCLETTSGCDICHNVDARRQNRHSRTRPWQERLPSPYTETEMTSHREEKESHKPSGIVTLYQSEIERTRWLSEQQLEKALVGTFFEPPRLVLVSSKIPKCQYIPKVLLDGENVIYIVYDFDTWSFIDITDAIQKKLESIKSGCKAKSICLLCQGGPGYMYILRKFVITPQKLKKDSYKSVKEFWKALSGQISKMSPSESKIHILGCRVGETKQGAEIKSMLQKIVQPNLVYLEAPNEETDQGKTVVSLYFNAKRYAVWKSHFDDSDDEEIDFEAEENVVDEAESAPRSWSSLANEVDSDD